MSDDISALEANIRHLEAETRALRQTLWDEFFKAAASGLFSHYGDVAHIIDYNGRTSIHFAAADHADQMMAMREKHRNATVSRRAEAADESAADPRSA